MGCHFVPPGTAGTGGSRIAKSALESIGSGVGGFIAGRGLSDCGPVLPEISISGCAVVMVAFKGKGVVSPIPAGAGPAGHHRGRVGGVWGDVWGMHRQRGTEAGSPANFMVNSDPSPRTWLTRLCIDVQPRPEPPWPMRVVKRVRRCGCGDRAQCRGQSPVPTAQCIGRRQPAFGAYDDAALANAFVAVHHGVVDQVGQHLAPSSPG